MPNNLAISDWVIFLSISNFFISVVFIGWIVKNIFTFVNKNLFMKKDAEIKDLLGRQVRKFLKDYVKGAFSDGEFKTKYIADEVKRHYPDEKVTKQNVNAWLKSPSLAFITWLEDTCSLNIDWLFHGEQDPSIKPIIPKKTK